MLGLETALALALTELAMPLADVVAALSWKPAAIAKLDARHGRPVVVGEPANLAVFDTRLETAAASLGTLRGKVRHAVFAGSAVVIDGVAQR